MWLVTNELKIRVFMFEYSQVASKYDPGQGKICIGHRPGATDLPTCFVVMGFMMEMFADEAAPDCVRRFNHDKATTWFQASLNFIEELTRVLNMVEHIEKEKR